MTGEGVKSDNVKLSHSVDEIISGDIGCLMGHAESFLSSRGIYFDYKCFLRLKNISLKTT